MNRPLLLDLFCKAGGCAVGYHRAGFDVIGVDIEPQPRYPFRMVVADALRPPFDLSMFDAIHASPPCQAFSSFNVMPNARQHPDLVEPTRRLLSESGKPWVIENVVGAPIESEDKPLFGSHGIKLCGTMFGLNDGTHELRRHRLFESSIRLQQPACRHSLPVIGFYGDHARNRKRTINRNRGTDITGDDRKMPLVRALMGIDWMKWQEVSQAIPPAYTEYIGKQLLARITA